MSTQQPRVSRETRRLLLAAVLAIVVLWLLARVRFTGGNDPDRAVQPILGQLAQRPTLADFAAEVARVQGQLYPLLIANGDVVALRIGDGSAVGLVAADTASQAEGMDVTAIDPATGLAIMAVDDQDVVLPTASWTPQRPGEPRFLLATSTSNDVVALRPVFVSLLDAVARAAWPGEIWRLSAPAELEPGAFVFTTTGDFAGLVIADGDGLALVTNDVLQLAIARLRGMPAGERGHLGFEVQPVTPRIAAATGSSGGIVVTWVDPEGAAARELMSGDVIEEVGGERVAADTWAVREARLRAGEELTLRVRRRGDVRDVKLVAAAPAVADALGLTLRGLPGLGAEVVQVRARTAAARAGLLPGDVITRAAGEAAPSPAQVRAAYAGRDEHGVLLALTRGTTHRVVVLGP